MLFVIYDTSIFSPLIQALFLPSYFFRGPYSLPFVKAISASLVCSFNFPLIEKKCAYTEGVFAS